MMRVGKNFKASIRVALACAYCTGTADVQQDDVVVEIVDTEHKSSAEVVCARHFGPNVVWQRGLALRRQGM